MTQDEIIGMTRRIGICELTSKPKQSIHYSLTIHQMEAFAKLVAVAAASKEREACAKVCEEMRDAWVNRPVPLLGYAVELDGAAIAIRARGKE